MAITYQYDKSSCVVQSIATGVITVQEILKYLVKVLEDSQIDRSFIEVVDFEGISNLVISYNDLSPFRDMWEKYKQKGCAATILYAPTDLAYGSFRMLQTVIEMYGLNDKEKFIIVRTKAELQEQIEANMPNKRDGADRKS